jgi:hypothetical protein
VVVPSKLLAEQQCGKWLLFKTNSVLKVSLEKWGIIEP